MPESIAVSQQQLADLRERFNNASDSLPPLACLLIQTTDRPAERGSFRSLFEGREKLARLAAESYRTLTGLYRSPQCGLHGVVAPGLLRHVLMQGTKAALGRFELLAAETGKCVARLGRSAAPSGVAESFMNEPDLRWVWKLFDLAWSQTDESLLTARRYVHVEGHSPVCYTPDIWQTLLDSAYSEPPGLPKSLLRELLEHPPECFYSEIPDLIRASVHAIDLIRVPPDRHAASDPKREKDPLHAVSAKAAKPTIKLPNLMPHDQQAWQLSFLRGMTQIKIAEQLNQEHGTTYTQGQVSRMIARAKKHAEASGVANLLQPKSEPARSIDPAKLDMGKRMDNRSPLRGRQDSDNN